MLLQLIYLAFFYEMMYYMLDEMAEMKSDLRLIADFIKDMMKK